MTDQQEFNKEIPQEPELKADSADDIKRKHKVREMSIAQKQTATKVLSIIYIALEILFMVYIVFYFYAMFEIYYPIAFLFSLLLIGAKVVTAFYSFKMTIRKDDDWEYIPNVKNESVWWHMSRWFYLFIVVQTVSSLILVVLFPLVMSDLAMAFATQLLILFGIDTLIYLLYASFTIVYLSSRLKEENRKIYNI